MFKTDTCPPTTELLDKMNGYSSVKRWLPKRKPGYQRQVARSLYHFQRITNLDPDQLIQFAKTHDNLETEDLLNDTVQKITTSTNEQNKQYYNLRGHLTRNGVPMPKHEATYIQNNEHPEYTKEEIRQLLTFLQEKQHKLYVYIAAETGLRSTHITQLRYKHIKQDLEANIIPTAVRLEPHFYTGRKLAGHTFLGQRSIDRLRDVWDQKTRDLVEEAITYEENRLQRTLEKDEKELFYTGNIRHQPHDDDLIIPQRYSTINEVLTRAKTDAKLNPNIQPSHGLRKYFENQLDQAGIDHTRKMRIEGHDAGARNHYTTEKWDELRKDYLKAYTWVNIDDPKGTSEADTIEKDLNELRKENIQLKADNHDLRNQFNQMNKLLREIADNMNNPHLRKTLDNLPSPLPTDQEEIARLPDLIADTAANQLKELAPFILTPQLNAYRERFKQWASHTLKSIPSNELTTIIDFCRNGRQAEGLLRLKQHITLPTVEDITSNQ